MEFVDLFFIVSLIIFVIALAGYMRSLEAKARTSLLSSEQISDKHCPPHKWQYETQTFVSGESVEFMICKRCRMRPGMIPSSYDKPY